MLAKAITSLRPGAEWILNGETYDGLDWLDQAQAKPSLKEINAEVNRLMAIEAANNYKLLRSAEYPDFKDYIDGVVKNDQQQIQAYIDACLAVKAKYPKPV
jgi:hypothetical protein